MSNALRTTVVIDYQNVHLVGHDVFMPKGTPKHETLLDPLSYAVQSVDQRNAHRRPCYPAADLRKVLVYRGEPSRPPRCLHHLGTGPSCCPRRDRHLRLLMRLRV